MLRKQNIFSSNICNCRNKRSCPLDGDCKVRKVVYKAEVIDTDD